METVSSGSAGLLVAGIGVAGTLIAALVTQWLGHRQEQRRWAREDRLRWHGERRKGCLRFLAALDNLQDGLIQTAYLLHSASLDKGGVGGKLQEAEERILALASENMHEVAQGLAEVRLLGSSRLVESGYTVFARVGQLISAFNEALHDMVEEAKTGDENLRSAAEVLQSRVTEKQEEIEEAQGMFIEAVR